MDGNVVGKLVAVVVTGVVVEVDLLMLDDAWFEWPLKLLHM